MELSPLAPRDLKGLSRLLQQVSRGLEFADAKILDTQTFKDPGFDSSYLIKAVEKKKMVGAAWGVVRKAGEAKTGYVKYVGVLPKFRRRGIAQAMLSELERRFQKREIRDIQIGGCPPPFLQGGAEVTDTALVSFLLSRGYQRKGDIVDMMSNLKTWKATVKPEDKAAVKAYGIRKAGARDEAGLLEMVAANFPGWAFEVSEGLKHGKVFMASENGKAVAFCCGDATNPGFFGPMGTVESLRGKGLARILSNMTLEAMKKSGHKTARIPWVGPIPFYAKFSGASLGPVYWQFAKKV